MSNQKQLINKILEASQLISKSSRKGSGNFILVSYDLVSDPGFSKAFFPKRKIRIKKILNLLEKINRNEFQN